jgi:hypothetical protein
MAFKSGEAESAESTKGEAKASGEPRKVSNIESVGSHAGKGVSFRMPKDSEISDHSDVKGMK